MNLHKLELSSVDGMKLNLEVLYQIVSSCVTEVKNKKTGELRRLVKENGKEAYNGLKMLLYQGVEAFELWNDVAVSKETADRIYQRMEQELSGK
jgi:shikimate dehydrogenase